MLTNKASYFIHNTNNELNSLQIIAFTGKPAHDLAQRVELCWFGFGQKGRDKIFYEIPPDGSINLIFRFSSSNCRAFLVGFANEKTCIEIDESCNYFGIRFYPGQASLLTDIHHSELVNNYNELPRILGVNVNLLGEQMFSLPTLELRQRFMEELLRKARPMVRDKRCRMSAALVSNLRGAITVSQLASEVGIHIRSLERLFIEHLGVTPRQFIRVTRFQNLLAQMRTNSRYTLTELAYLCGYFDQSHMIKDFRELSGRLPGEPGSCKNQRSAGKPDSKIVHHLC